jgi:hypothetical protein
MTNCAPQKDGVNSLAGDSVPVADSLKSFGTTAAAVPSEPEFKVDNKFQQQVGDVFTSYVVLKEILVASDSSSVADKSGAVMTALNKVDLELLSGDAEDKGRQYFSSLKNLAADIHASGEIENQRRAFSELSDSLYLTIKAFGLGGKQAFYDFCPMAFNQEGAFWLSDQEPIRNPYFGDKMLTCGEVKEKLK